MRMLSMTGVLLGAVLAGRAEAQQRVSPLAQEVDRRAIALEAKVIAWRE